MPRTPFQPEQHGFHFGNHFVNQLARLPGGRRITSAGRCGGMSYAALDCFYAGCPIPSCKTSDFQAYVPPDGTSLADYIWRRQIDSLLVATSLKFLVWSCLPDRPFGPLAGVSRWTKEREFPRLRASIDAGRPAVLVLIKASGARGMLLNHQVVAVGYDEQPAAQRIDIFVYDSNHPDQEAVLRSERGMPGFRESTGEEWRGFHVHRYRPRRPPDLTAEV
jgi:hypothetical protein